MQKDMLGHPLDMQPMWGGLAVVISQPAQDTVVVDDGVYMSLENGMSSSFDRSGPPAAVVLLRPPSMCVGSDLLKLFRNLTFWQVLELIHPV